MPLHTKQEYSTRARAVIPLLFAEVENDEKWAYSSPIAIGAEENSHRSADKQLSEYGQTAIHRRLGWLSVSGPIAILPQTG